MSAEEEQSRPAAGDAPGQPNEEELRARLEDELRKLRVQDVLLQSVVSLINLTSRRIAKEDEQDLEQARIGIEAIQGAGRPAGRGASPAGQERALGAPDALREGRRGDAWWGAGGRRERRRSAARAGRTQAPAGPLDARIGIDSPAI